MTELLKKCALNSIVWSTLLTRRPGRSAFRATVEYHRKITGSSTPKLPPVLITISTTTTDVFPPHSRDRYGSTPPRTFSPTMFAPQEPPTPTTRSTLCIRVRDSGGGIPPEHMKDVFSYAFTTVGKGGSGDDDEASTSSGPYETVNSGGSGTSVLSQSGMQTGLGTLAGLGYGLPMVRCLLDQQQAIMQLTRIVRTGSDLLSLFRRLA